LGRRGLDGDTTPGRRAAFIGTADDTAKVVAELMSEHAAVELETHRHNLGKAAALRHGFRRAVDAGATG